MKKFYENLGKVGLYSAVLVFGTIQVALTLFFLWPVCLFLWLEGDSPDHNKSQAYKVGRTVVHLVFSWGWICFLLFCFIHYCEWIAKQ